MKKTGLLILSFVAFAAISCERTSPFVDEIPGADKSAFRVFSSKVTDLSKGIPSNCPVPAEYGTKTTSVPINNLVSDIFETNRKGKVIELAGTYTSADYHTGKSIELSGKVLLPKDRKPKRYIVVSHYTIASNDEAPSNIFPLEGIICDMGYAMIFPDYQGYGVDYKKIHPYLVMEQTAYDVVMMYQSVEQYLRGTEYEPENEGIYLMGFSQGGAVTMSTLWMMEERLGMGDKVAQVFAGGGPYDVRATFNNFIETNKVNIAPAVPFVLQSMIKCYGADVDIRKALKPWICDKLDEWINSKKYSVNQLRDLIGTTKTSDLLTEECMDRTSDIVSELYKAMTENSVLAQDWTPKAPVYIMHSIDDNVVPFVNASKAKDKWKDANIQYNFGHYGNHVNSTLRFIFSVKNWLKDDN